MKSELSFIFFTIVLQVVSTVVNILARRNKTTFIKEDRTLKDLVKVLVSHTERRMVRAVAKRLAESEVYDEYFIQCAQLYAKAYDMRTTAHTAELGNVLICRKNAPVKQVVTAVKTLVTEEDANNVEG